MNHATENIDTQYALICFENINLLLPQQEITVVELLDSVVFKDNPDNKFEIGEFNNESNRGPVYSLSAEFQNRMKSNNDRFCVCMTVPQFGTFGLLCFEIKSFLNDDDALELTPIQDFMTLNQNPIERLAYYQNALYLQTSAKNLYQYVN